MEIPITELLKKGATIHQLAAHYAIKELEEGRGWLSIAKDGECRLLKDKFDGKFSDMVEREAIRLGLQYQMAGKHCFFVATQEDSCKVPEDTVSEDAVEFEVVQDSTSIWQFAIAPTDAFGVSRMDLCNPLRANGILLHLQRQHNMELG